jgi:hypothetical protein
MRGITRSAQTTDKSDAQQTGVVLSKLSQPVYPRLAQAWQISGDVDVTVPRPAQWQR